MSANWQPVNPTNCSVELRNIYLRKRVLLQQIRKQRGIQYYPDYWVLIVTYRSFIRNVLSDHCIRLSNINIIHDILYMIAEKTKEVWSESYTKVQQIIDQYQKVGQIFDQYQCMSIRDWIKLVYDFTNEICISMDKQTTCGYELDYSNIVDVLIETANFRWTLPIGYTTSMCELIQYDNTTAACEPIWQNFKLSATRVLSMTPIQICDNKSKTVLSFIKQL